MASSSTDPEASDALQLLFMGTGTSTGLPIACCLANVPSLAGGVADYLSALSPAALSHPRAGQYDPRAPWPRNVACPSCRAAVDTAVPDGWKNRRGNPGLVLRRRDGQGRWRNVVVDVGKTFREQSLKLFPRWGVQSIDAVLITHGHADAYYGLDDLREWCVRQKRAIPIYLTQATYDTVAGSFPYLVDKTRASGGGDIPTLQWHIIDEEAEFEVEGINVTTLPVHHGRYFSQPTSSDPDAPAQPKPFICLGYVFDREIVYLSDVSAVPDSTWTRMTRALGGKPQSNGHVDPATNGGVAIGNRGAEVVERPIADGDVKSAEPVPADTAAQANGTVGGVTDGHAAASANSRGATQVAGPQLLVVDTLWVTRPHASHISFAQALAIAARLRPRQAYIVGMTHPTTHYEWEELGQAVDGLAADGHGEDAAAHRETANGTSKLNGTRDDGKPAGTTDKGADLHPEHETALRTLARFWDDADVRALKPQLADWVRGGGAVGPAWDGLGVEVRPGGMRVLPEGQGTAGGWMM